MKGAEGTEAVEEEDWRVLNWNLWRKEVRSRPRRRRGVRRGEAELEAFPKPAFRSRKILPTNCQSRVDESPCVNPEMSFSIDCQTRSSARQRKGGREREV